MERNVLIGGFGGQGVQTLGKLLGHCANEAGMITTFHPAYGGEMRGGTSNCTVTVSDRLIGAPDKKMCDYIIAMNIPSFQRFEKQVKPGGTFILNTSIVKELPKRTDIKCVGIPVNEIAEEVGSPRILNIVMLGFFAEYTGFVPVDVMKKVLDERLGYKVEFRDLNARAFEKGVDYAKSLKANA
jgi:2-oxoglutarate ferredoxin oxidoreductase subunit gamma